MMNAMTFLRVVEEALLAGDPIESEYGPVDDTVVAAIFDAARTEVSYWDD